MPRRSTKHPILVKPIHSAIMLAFCALGAGEAKSICIGAGTATTVTCTSPPNDTSSIHEINGSGNISATLTNWVMDNGSLDIKATSGNIALTGDNVTVTNGASTGDAMIHMASSLNGGSASIDIKNSTLSATSNAQGITSHAVNGSGDATVKTDNVQVNMGISTVGAGINSVANGTGKATIDMTSSTVNVASGITAINGYTTSGSVDITTQGGSVTATGNGYAIRGTVASGSGSLFVRNGSTLNTVATAIYTSAANGLTEITNSGVIQTSGASAYGIHGSSTGSTVKINNTNSVTTSGLRSHAIFVQGSTGQTTINNHAALTTTGDDSKGIAANYNGTSGGITVNHHAGATITTSGGNSANSGYSLANGSAGILLSTTPSAVGDLLAIVDGNITAHGVNRAGGVFVNNVGVGNATIRATGNILTDNTTGPFSYGLSANIGNQTTSHGDASIYYTNASGTVETRANDSAALYAYIDTAANGNVRIENVGTLKTSGAGASNGIWARVLHGAGTATVVNHGAIATTGAQSSSGSPNGIRIETQTGDVNLTNSGAVSTVGDSAAGILVNSSNAHITSDISGNITTAGTFSPAIELISSRNAEGTASNLLNYHDGVAVIGAGSNAISLWNGGAATGSGEVRIGPNVIVDARRGLAAVQNLMSEDSLINISAGAQINGGTAGIEAGGQRITLNTAGNISAMSDLVIQNGAFPVATQQMNIVNQASGTMTGYVMTGSGTNSLTNSGLWNLRNFADSDGDRVRDTLSVATSDFGTSGNNGITNNGTMTLLGDGGAATALNNTGEYATGYAANTMAIGGAVQGHILNVRTFTNNGLIDMGPANAAVGDVLLISGGSTPGTSGGGVYIANSGSALKLDTHLNEGGANSQSDMLIIDSTRLGTGATTINLTTSGVGALTVNNGIELVRVLDSTQSAPGVFQLSGRIVSGVYEYDLYQGNVGASAGDGNWYLRSITTPVPPGPTPTPTPSLKPAPRPEPYLYVRNMAAASGMFVHTLHDRLGEPQYTDTYRDKNKAPNEDKVPAGWVRVVGNHADSESAQGRIDLDTDTTLIHFGGDIARWYDNDGDNRYHLGLMGAYGKSETDALANDVRFTQSGIRRKASGDVEGYSIGAYATWYGNGKQPEGPYIDTWAQYGWYTNTVKGNTLAKEKYDSKGWTASVEGGYALIAKDGETRQWMIEPQIQLAYNAYNEDNHREANGTWVDHSDADGWITRLGARLYSRSKKGDNGIQPFVEANWWNSSANNTLNFNGQTVSDGAPDNRYELKIGVQGELAKRWQLWGHIGNQWGKDHYNRYEGMIGTKYVF